MSDKEAIIVDQERRIAIGSAPVEFVEYEYRWEYNLTGQFVKVARIKDPLKIWKVYPTWWDYWYAMALEELDNLLRKDREQWQEDYEQALMAL